MRNIGVWLDKKEARIAILDATSEEMIKVASEVEFFNRKGGGAPRMKWGGPQDVVHENTYEEREKHQLRAYFKKLTETIHEADSLIILGPSSTGEEFRKDLLEHHKELAQKVKLVTKTDKMTDNQIMSMVRDYFKTGSLQHNFSAKKV
jgi:hypothetical protein